jgi:hypothetical protein
LEANAIAGSAEESEAARAKAGTLAKLLRDITPELDVAILRYMNYDERRLTSRIHVMDRNDYFTTDQGHVIRMSVLVAESGSRQMPSIWFTTRGVSGSGSLAPRIDFESIHLTAADGRRIRCRNREGDGRLGTCDVKDNTELQEIETVEFAILGERYVGYLGF